MREAMVEAYLVERVEANGGTAEKFTSPARRNVPDRIVCWPDRDWRLDFKPIPASACFVECKATGEEPTPAQLRDHNRRRAMGFRVYVVDSYESVDQFIKSEGFFK